MTRPPVYLAYPTQPGGPTHATMPNTYGTDMLATAWCDGSITVRVQATGTGEPRVAQLAKVTCPRCWTKVNEEVKRAAPKRRRP